MKRSNWLKLVAIALIACTTTVFAEDAKVPAATTVKGNPDSKIYHKAMCKHYAAKGSTKEFKSEADAIKAGYKPCKRCAAPKKEEKKEKKTSSAAHE